MVSISLLVFLNYLYVLGLISLGNVSSKINSVVEGFVELLSVNFESINVLHNGI